LELYNLYKHSCIVPAHTNQKYLNYKKKHIEKEVPILLAARMISFLQWILSHWGFQNWYKIKRTGEKQSEAKQDF
jgi:hypothetical protein